MTMKFKQTEDLKASAYPETKEVVRWLWMIDKADSYIVQRFGRKMVDTYFESRGAAETFIIHDRGFSVCHTPKLPVLLVLSGCGSRYRFV